MNDIFLGKLPTMVQGSEPLGEELIAKLEEYSKNHQLPSYELLFDDNDNYIAKVVK